jgi:hypothetical protein
MLVFLSSHISNCIKFSSFVIWLAPPSLILIRLGSSLVLQAKYRRQIGSHRISTSSPLFSLLSAFSSAFIGGFWVGGCRGRDPVVGVHKKSPPYTHPPSQKGCVKQQIYKSYPPLSVLSLSLLTPPLLLLKC